MAVDWFLIGSIDVAKNTTTRTKKVSKGPRASIPEDVRDEVLKRCRRVCCMCFGLHGLNLDFPDRFCGW